MPTAMQHDGPREYTCPCGVWFVEPPPLCATCGEPCCPRCIAHCEICEAPIHQQLPALGNQQCMFAFEDMDGDSGLREYKLVCGPCSAPGVVAERLDAAEREREAARLAQWAKDMDGVFGGEAA